jgi:hypothetical protein
MRQLPLSIAILLCAGLAACATAEPPKTVSDVSCAAFTTISYAQLARGQVDDIGNRADSDETVRQIEAHNARHDALCGNPLQPPGG